MGLWDFPIIKLYKNETNDRKASSLWERNRYKFFCGDEIYHELINYYEKIVIKKAMKNFINSLPPGEIYGDKPRGFALGWSP